MWHVLLLSLVVAAAFSATATTTTTTGTSIRLIDDVLFVNGHAYPHLSARNSTELIIEVLARFDFNASRPSVVIAGSCSTEHTGLVAAALVHVEDMHVQNTTELTVSATQPTHTKHTADTHQTCTRHTADTQQTQTRHTPTHRHRP